jgi:hypothetical protein
MPGDLKLQFGIDVTGADRFSQAIRTITQDLNNIPKSVQGGLKDLNAAFKNISSEVGSLNRALAEMGDDKGPMAAGMQRLKTKYIESTTKALQDLRSEFKNLNEESDRWNKIADREQAAGRPGLSKIMRGRAAAAQSAADYMIPGILAAEQDQDQKEGARKTGEEFGKSSGIIQLVQTMLSGAGGIAGAALKYGPWVAGGLAATALIGSSYQNIVGLGGIQRETAAMQYLSQGGREIALQHNPLRALLRQQGVGPEAELIRYQNDQSFKINPFNRNALRTLGQGLRATYDWATGGFKTNAFNESLERQMTSFSEAGMERYGQTIGQVISFRNQTAQQMFLPESMMGQAGARAALARLAGQGLDPTTALRIMNLQGQFGMTPGTGDAARLGLMRERFGVGEAMERMMAMRMARTGGATAFEGDWRSMLGAAGLGPQNTAARQAFSEAAAQILGAQGFIGEQDISGALSGFSGAVRGAGEAGAQGVQAVGLGTQAFGAMQQNARTPFTPQNTMLMASLMGMGMSRIAAATLINSNVLTNAAAQQSGANALGISVSEFRRRIGAPQEAMRQRMVRGIMRQMTPQEQGALGEGAAGVLMMGAPNLEAGKELEAATGGMLRDIAEGPPQDAASRVAAGRAAEPGAPTTMGDLRKEAADFAKAMALALKDVGPLLPQTTKDAIETMQKDVAAITGHALGYHTATVGAPGTVGPTQQGGPTDGTKK